MYIDMFGKVRLKVGLHNHTTLSDGQKSPDEIKETYAMAGYDAIAITDHWVYSISDDESDLKIISGCEYNVGANATEDGVYHILGLGMKFAPPVQRTTEGTPEDRAYDIVKKIRQADGIAILAHPAWSLNQPDLVEKISDFDAIEIFNTISGVGSSNRPYSGIIVDQLANRGMILPLTAADDTHHCDGTDNCISYIMVEAYEFDTDSIIRAIRAGRFYSTQGPEVHIERINNEQVKVSCSPSSKIEIFTNAAHSPRNFSGDDLVEATYNLSTVDKWVRAEVCDSLGRRAWTNILKIEN